MKSFVHKVVLLAVAPIMALSSFVFAPISSPIAAASNGVNVYTTEGTHHVNGREWKTRCEKYSSNIDRCFTEIKSSGKWVFNNLTYLPSSRAIWSANPLAGHGVYGAKTNWRSDGREWRSECDTQVSGRNGCRAYIKSGGKWVFNNIVLFSVEGNVSAPSTPSPTNPATSQPTPTATTTKPVVTPTNPSSPNEFPNESNTGVPNGVRLTAYTGDMNVQVDNTIIKDKIITGRLRINAANVQIINSRINGYIDLRDPKTTNRSVSLVDSEIHVGNTLDTGISRGNMKLNRVEITGGRRSVYCQYNCLIENSLVHKQSGDVGGQAHFSGMRMEQNGTFRHNTITCEALRGPGTGCSAGLTGYGDFAPVQNNLIENNLFLGGGGGGSTVCAYGGSSGSNGGKPYGHLANNIRFIDNVWVKGANGKCGTYGPILDFDLTRPGNVWQGNTWSDGTPLSHTGR